MIRRKHCKRRELNCSNSVHKIWDISFCKMVLKFHPVLNLEKQIRFEQPMFSTFDSQQSSIQFQPAGVCLRVSLLDYVQFNLSIVLTVHANNSN